MHDDDPPDTTSLDSNDGECGVTVALAAAALAALFSLRVVMRAHQDLRLDEPDRGEDDHGAEHGLQVLHRLGEEEQDEEDC